jgi:hypothetical protein
MISTSYVLLKKVDRWNTSRPLTARKPVRVKRLLYVFRSKSGISGRLRLCGEIVREMHFLNTQAYFISLLISVRILKSLQLER